MKKATCLAGLLGLGCLIYALFQPVFNNFVGWEELPNEVFKQKFIGIENSLLADEINFSKRHIDSIQKVSHAPSVSVSVMINSEIVWSYAVGYRDINLQKPADTSTIYRIGSVSKALTSLGLGYMMQEGQIHLDSSIQFYTEAFADKPKTTIKQLASHQSGIRNYGTCLCFPIWEYYRNKEFKNVRQGIADFESDDLLFHPGDDFSYSSYNFTLLSLAMENTSNTQFTNYMEQEIFKALKMYSTFPEDLSKPDRAIPYEVDHSYHKIAPEVNLSNKWAGGGFVSTPSDLVRAGNALLDTALLNKPTVNTITTPQKLNNGDINEQNYALGWRHNHSTRFFDGMKEVDIIHHGGMAMGGTALLIVFPEYDMVISIAINKSSTPGNFKLFDYVTPITNTFLSSIEEKKSYN